MKQIVCEMCGGTDMVKTDGFFICQNCGIKYSPEEAKKMMIEVQGTVQIDRSGEIENMLKNADATFQEGNYNAAHDLYSQVLNFNPDNTQAILYRGLSIGWQTTTKMDHTNESCIAAMRAMKIKLEQVRDSKKYCDFCIEVFIRTCDLTTAISQMYIGYYNRLRAQIGLTDFVNQTNLSDILYTGQKKCSLVVSMIAKTSLDLVKDYAEVEDTFINVGIVFIIKEIMNRQKAGFGSDKELNDLIYRFNALRYWQKHPDEKKALSDEIDSLEKQKEALGAEISALESNDRVKELNSLVARLNEEKKSMTHKEKKAAQQQIDAGSFELFKLESDLKDKIKSLREMIPPLDEKLKNA